MSVRPAAGPGAPAQALARAKEAGLRKVLGARRGQVLAQHFVEAGLMVLAAIAIAVILIAIATPVFRRALGADPLYFKGMREACCSC